MPCRTSLAARGVSTIGLLYLHHGLLAQVGLKPLSSFRGCSISSVDLLMFASEILFRVTVLQQALAAFPAWSPSMDTKPDVKPLPIE